MIPRFYVEGMGPRKSQRTIQPRPTQFRMKDIMMQVVPFQSFEIMGGKGGEGREGMTHSNCILESACKRIKRQRKKKEYEMYKTESQNSERAGWVPERPEPSIATKKKF